MKWTSDKHKYNLTREGGPRMGLRTFLKKLEKEKPFKKLTSYDERVFRTKKKRNQLFYCSIILFILSPTFLQPFFSSTNNFLQTFLGKIVSKTLIQTMKLK